MISENSPAPKCSLKSVLFAGLLLFLLAVGLQVLTGAYHSEFGSEPDEAAHCVTGLCVRDYVAAGFPGNPLTYAKKYYDHYPKVALGHWPPFFYVLQTAWTIPFGASRVSILLMMAFLTAGVATLVFNFLKCEFNMTAGAVGAALFLAFPLVQRFGGAVMTEIPVAFLALLATLAFARFLEREKRADMIWFGVLAGLTILTKQSGFMLAFVPPLALVFTRKFHLLRSLWLWAGAGVVALIAGPWTALTLKLAGDGMAEEKLGWDFTHKAVPYYLGKFYFAVGTAVLVLAVVGLWAKLFRRGQPVSPRWAAVAALAIGVILLHFVIPCGFESRHLVPALAPTAMLAVAGMIWLAGELTRRGVANNLAVNLVAMVLVVGFGLETFRLSVKGYAGFWAVADTFLKTPGAEKARVLVSSDARGEGMFISEMALREKRLGHIIRRGSKELASSSWSGGGYQTKFADEATLVAFLRKNAIEFLVLDDSFPRSYRKDYHDLLTRAAANTNDFQFIHEFPIQRDGAVIAAGAKFYRLAGR